jgi:hypothetical protein
MKLWHWILIGGGLLIGAVVFLRSRVQTTAQPGPKLGTGAPGVDAGAPPLPIIAPASNKTAPLMAFATFGAVNSFGRRTTL